MLGTNLPGVFFFFFRWGTMCMFVYEWLYECVSLTLIQTVDSSALTFTSCLPKALGENLELSQISLGHVHSPVYVASSWFSRFLVIYQSFSKAQWASHSPEFHFFSFQVFNKPVVYHNYSLPQAAFKQLALNVLYKCPWGEKLFSLRASSEPGRIKTALQGELFREALGRSNNDSSLIMRLGRSSTLFLLPCGFHTASFHHQYYEKTPNPWKKA